MKQFFILWSAVFSSWIVKLDRFWISQKHAEAEVAKFCDGVRFLKRKHDLATDFVVVVGRNKCLFEAYDGVISVSENSKLRSPQGILNWGFLQIKYADYLF